MVPAVARVTNATVESRGRLLCSQRMDPHNPNDRIVPFSSKLAFGVGQFAEGLKNTGFGLFILFYYNQVLEMPGALAGAALFIALLFDAVTDPLAGSLSDKWQSRLGRRHPFMYASALPLALAFVGLFSPPEGLGQWGLFLWLTAFATLTRGAMTLYHVPHLALGAELTQNYNERNRVVAYRQFFATAGSATVIAVGFGYFFSDDMGGRLAIENYTPFAIVLAVLMAVTIWYSAAGTQKEVPFLSEPPPRPARNAFLVLGSDFLAAFGNRSFAWMISGVLVIYIMSGVHAALDIYMYQYFWELDGGQMMRVNLAPIAGLLVGVFVAAPLLPRIGKRAGVILAVASVATCTILPVVCRLLDAFPENGTGALFYALVGFKFVQGLTVQQAFIAAGSMLADVADEHELDTGTRQEGIFFGAISFSGKATSGVGTLIGGIGLDIIDWPTGAEIVSATDIPAGTLVDLGVLYGPVVAGCAVITIWCLSHYNLDRERHAEILGKLAERRRAGARPGALDTAAGSGS